jgi:bifunctional DNA-binding transcriptional regulator/antitoxin component of YhaV-PrlF toxin-antitoxin module
VQVPKYVRWHYRLESTQILEVTVSILGVWRPPQSFLSRISKDGRIVIPKLAIALFKDGKFNLDNPVAEVRLDPL